MQASLLLQNHNPELDLHLSLAACNLKIHIGHERRRFPTSYLFAPEIRKASDGNMLAE